MSRELQELEFAQEVIYQMFILIVKREVRHLET
jgi:hypothetical protein